MMGEEVNPATHWTRRRWWHWYADINGAYWEIVRSSGGCHLYREGKLRGVYTPPRQAKDAAEKFELRPRQRRLAIPREWA